MKLKILVLIIAVLALVSCVAKENDSTSGSFLVINSLTGNDLEGTAGSTTVFSDVSLASSIVNDNGVASITAQTYNPLEDPADARHHLLHGRHRRPDRRRVHAHRRPQRRRRGCSLPFHPADEYAGAGRRDGRHPLRSHPPRGQAGSPAAGLARGPNPGEFVLQAGGQGDRARQGPGRTSGGAGERLHQRLVRQFRRCGTGTGTDADPPSDDLGR